MLNIYFKMIIQESPKLKLIFVTIKPFVSQRDYRIVLYERVGETDSHLFKWERRRRAAIK